MTKSLERQRNERAESTPVAPDVEPPPRRPSKKVIVAVQLPSTRPPSFPIANTREEAMARPRESDALRAQITSEDKTIHLHVVASRPLFARFGPGERRAFFWAEIDVDGEIEIGDRAPAQTW